MNAPIPFSRYALTFDVSEAALLARLTDENYDSVVFCGGLLSHDLVTEYGQRSCGALGISAVRLYAVSHSRSFLEEQAETLRGFSNLTNVRVVQLPEVPDQTSDLSFAQPCLKVHQTAPQSGETTGDAPTLGKAAAKRTNPTLAKEMQDWIVTCTPKEST